MINERLKTTRHHQLAQEVQEMEQQNEQLQNDLKEAKILQDQGEIFKEFHNHIFHMLFF